MLGVLNCWEYSLTEPFQRSFYINSCQSLPNDLTYVVNTLLVSTTLSYIKHLLWVSALFSDRVERNSKSNSDVTKTILGHDTNNERTTQAIYERLGDWTPLRVKVLKTRATVWQLLAPTLSSLPHQLPVGPGSPAPCASAQTGWRRGGPWLPSCNALEPPLLAPSQGRSWGRLAQTVSLFPFPALRSSSAKSAHSKLQANELTHCTNPTFGSSSSWCPPPRNGAPSHPASQSSSQCRTCSCPRRRAISSNAFWWVLGAARCEWSSCGARGTPQFCSLFALRAARPEYPPLQAPPDRLSPRPPGLPLRASSLWGCSPRSPQRTFQKLHVALRCHPGRRPGSGTRAFCGALRPDRQPPFAFPSWFLLPGSLRPGVYYLLCV